MNKFMKIINVFFGVSLLFAIFYVVIGEITLPREHQNTDGYFESYEDNWKQVLVSGERVAIEVPSDIVSENKRDCTIENILPSSIEEDAYLIFRSSKQDMEIYVNGELRESYSTHNTRYFGQMSPVYYVFVKINPEDTNQIVQAHYHSVARYSGAISDIAYANYNGFWNNMMLEQGRSLLIAIFMLIVSTLTLIVSLVASIIYRHAQKLLSISLGVLLVAVWMLGNSAFRQIIFPNVSTVGDMTFLAVTLIPYPFAVYINELQDKRHDKFYAIIKVAAVLDTFVCAILHMTGRVDFATSFYGMAGVLGLLVAVIVVSMILDAIHGYIRKYIVTAFSLLIAGVAMVIQVGIYLSTDFALDTTVAALGLFVMLVVAGIDSLKELYRMTEEKQRALGESAAKSQFLATMSHEIRTPINAVLGMDTMILRESTDENILKYARDIQSAGKSLLSVINDILDFSKIESGKMVLVPVEYSLSGLVRDLDNMIRPKATDKSLDFEIVLDPELPSHYFGDDVRLRQVLVNLLTNAVKYTNEGKVMLCISGEVEGNVAKLTFSAKDTGIGIKPEDLHKLSEEYVRIEESRNRNVEGTGLGISIVINLLKLMGSHLELESVYGEGSNFHFSVSQPVMKLEPIGENVLQVQETTEDENYEASFVMPDAKLLVVDDNAMNRNVFRNLLKEMECRIDEADSGKECLRMVAEETYDLIFMDHMMPEMDGIETLEHMQAMEDSPNHDTPVIILTANAVSGMREEYLRKGFREYLTKPIDADKLEELLGKLISAEKKKETPKRTKVASDGIALMEVDFPTVDGVDWQHAMLKLRSKELLEESTKNFATAGMVDAKTLASYFDEKGEGTLFDEFRIKVHSMKSNAATIGADHVAGLAKYLEYAAAAKDTDTMERLLPVFLREWKALVVGLKEAFGWERESSGERIDRELLVSYLENLKEALQDVDFDRSDAIMEALQEYSFEEPEQDYLEELKAHVLNMDMDAGCTLMDQWIAQTTDRDEGAV